MLKIVNLIPDKTDTDNQTITAFSLNAATKILTLTLQRGNTMTVDLSTLAPASTADNGLNKSSATNTQLGGPLTGATTITTTAANTLAIPGLQTGAETDKVVTVTSTGVLQALKGALPKFFYAPSVVVPTHDSNGVPLTGNQTLDIYSKYSQQFGFSGGIGQARSNASSTLPVLPASELDYFVTYFDNTVFNTVTVSTAGVITYTVKSTAIATEASFMNIVFKVK